MTGAISIALSGLNAASLRLNASASNIANFATAGSLTDPDNAPYTPLITQNTALDNGGVQAEYAPKPNPFVPAYDPDSPFADADGFIGAPNVDLAEEIVNLKLAEISYKANLNTIKAQGNLFDELLGVFDDD